MNFIEAIELAKQGKRIRTKYSGENYYQMSNGNKTLSDHDFNDVNELSLDLILNDYDGWEIYEAEKPKTYSFQEALKEFENGKTIRRLIKSKKYYDQEGVNIDDVIFTLGDVLATDWLIMEN
jgi:hypothetical protein